MYFFYLLELSKIKIFILSLKIFKSKLHFINLKKFYNFFFFKLLFYQLKLNNVNSFFEFLSLKS